MEKDITYGIMSGETSDYNVNDGILQQAVNVERRGGDYHVARVPDTPHVTYYNKKPIYIHYTSDRKRFTLLLDSADNEIGVIMKGEWKGILTLQYEPSSIHAIGNMLIILSNETNHFVVYKAGSYKYLGTRIPDVKLAFRAVQVPFGYENTHYSDEAAAAGASYYIKGYFRNMRRGISTKNSDAYIQIPNFDYENIQAVTDAVKGTERWQKVLNLIFGAFNYTKSEHIDKKGRFIFPVLIRYAIKLYDGSYVNISAPQISINRDDVVNLVAIAQGYKFWPPTVDKGVEFTELKIEYLSYKIFTSLREYDKLKDFEDIVQSVDIFISEPLYTIETNDLTPCNFMSGDTVTGMALVFKERDLFETAKNVSNFYKIASIPFEDFSKHERWMDIFGDSKVKCEKDITNYTTNEVLTETLHSNSRYAISQNLVYNKRLIQKQTKRFIKSYEGCNMRDSIIPLYKYDTPSDYSQGMIRGEDYNQSQTDYYEANTEMLPSAEYPDYYSYEAELFMKVDNGYKKYSIVLPKDNIFPIYFPVEHNKSCKIVVIRSEGKYVYDDVTPDVERKKYYVFPLENTQLPCSQVLSKKEIFEHGGWNDYTTEIYDGVTEDDFVYNTSLVSSEVNNPFFSKDSNSLVLGSNLIALATSAMEISTGQFGQYPLFAFCEDGVFAISVGTDGSLQSCVPFSYDTLINKESVSTIDRSLVFITSQGIIQIGDNRQSLLNADSNITYDLDNEHQKGIVKSEANGGTPTTMTNLAFYLTDGARCAYDYAHQRLIVFNPDYDYSYVYSFIGQSWSIITKRFTHALNGYDNCLLVSKETTTDEDGVMNEEWKVWDYSSDDFNEKKKSGYIITRPFKLDNPDVFKTIKTIIQRGVFKKESVHQALYGSRDNYNWAPVWSSKSEYMENVSGTGYKYFRLIVFLNDWTQKESLSGCSIQFEQRETNRLR